jgi:hypothetical protein
MNKGFLPHFPNNRRPADVTLKLHPHHADLLHPSPFQIAAIDSTIIPPLIDPNPYPLELIVLSLKILLPLIHLLLSIFLQILLPPLQIHLNLIISMKPNNSICLHYFTYENSEDELELTPMVNIYEAL